MYTDPQALSENAGRRPDAAFALRDERHAVALFARYAWKGLRGTIMLKDLTLNGARIDGLEALRQGDGLTLLMPDTPAIECTVCWTLSRAAGLFFEQALDPADLARVIRDFGTRTLEPLTPKAFPSPADSPASAPALPRRLCT